MELNITIKTISREDYDQLIELARLIFNSFDFYWFRYWLPRTRIIAAYTNPHTIIGFAQVYRTSTPCGRTGVILYLGVHPDWRGRGVGKRLVIEAEKLFQRQGVLFSMASTRRYNTVVQRLFQGLNYVLFDLECIEISCSEGFEFVKALHAYEDDVLMYKRLGAERCFLEDLRNCIISEAPGSS